MVSTVLLILLVLILLPFVFFYCAKLATYGFYRARQSWERRNPKRKGD